jgi:hypothetical protein
VCYNKGLGAGWGGEGGLMALTAAESDVLSDYLRSFVTLTGDRRTAWLLGEAVRGIIGSESLCCSRIAAFSPWAGGGQARRGAGAADGPR